MRVKITIEDSSERWVTLEETEVRELQFILNSLLKIDTEASKAEESPERCANEAMEDNYCCEGCNRSHI